MWCAYLAALMSETHVITTHASTRPHKLRLCGNWSKMVAELVLLMLLYWDSNKKDSDIPEWKRHSLSVFGGTVRHFISLIVKTWKLVGWRMKSAKVSWHKLGHEFLLKDSWDKSPSKLEVNLSRPDFTASLLLFCVWANSQEKRTQTRKTKTRMFAPGCLVHSLQNVLAPGCKSFCFHPHFHKRLSETAPLKSRNSALFPKGKLPEKLWNYFYTPSWSRARPFWWLGKKQSRITHSLPHGPQTQESVTQKNNGQQLCHKSDNRFSFIAS